METQILNQRVAGEFGSTLFLRLVCSCHDTVYGRLLLALAPNAANEPRIPVSGDSFRKTGKLPEMINE